MHHVICFYLQGGQTIQLQVKVIPGSSRTCVAGWLGKVLKVRVRPPAERGKANQAVEKTVSQALGVSGGCVRILKGLTSSRKVLEITGLSEAEVYERLPAAVGRRGIRVSAKSIEGLPLPSVSPGISRSGSVRSGVWKDFM